MSINAIDYAGALAHLDEELLRRFPDCDRSDPREADRKLVEEGKITENQLLQLYSEACGVQGMDEEDIGEDIPWFDVRISRKLSFPMCVSK